MKEIVRLEILGYPPSCHFAGPQHSLETQSVRSTKIVRWFFEQLLDRVFLPPTKRIRFGSTQTKRSGVVCVPNPGSFLVTAKESSGCVVHAVWFPSAHTTPNHVGNPLSRGAASHTAISCAKHTTDSICSKEHPCAYFTPPPVLSDLSVFFYWFKWRSEAIERWESRS